MTRATEIQQKLRDSLHRSTLLRSYEQRFAGAAPRVEPSRQGARRWVSGRRQKHKRR